LTATISFVLLLVVVELLSTLAVLFAFESVAVLSVDVFFVDSFEVPHEAESNTASSG
jgi:hypothetical protein